MRFNKNNFDLIRLFAATQVMVIHFFGHYELEETTDNYLLHGLIELCQYFPGVPIFFMISGYLISRSYERNSDLKNYFRNRFLRLYPAAWFCLIISLMFLIYTKHLEFETLNGKSFWFWLATEIGFIHIYSYSEFSEFGVGRLNGSLWTLQVEFQFYIFIPILYYIGNKIKIKEIKRYNLFMMGLLFSSFFYHEQIIKNNILGLDAIGNIYSGDNNYLNPSNLVSKVIVNLLPNYFYMFALGIILQKNLESIRSLIKDRAHYWLISYLTICLSLEQLNFEIAYGNDINLIMFIFLSLVVISIAYSKVHISEKILGRNDLSYGVYIFHMPIANLMIEMNDKLSMNTFYFSLLLTYLFAFISWKLIEKPAMKMKKKSINTIT